MEEKEITTLIGKRLAQIQEENSIIACIKQGFTASAQSGNTAQPHDDRQNQHLQIWREIASKIETGNPAYKLFNEQFEQITQQLMRCIELDSDSKLHPESREHHKEILALNKSTRGYVTRCIRNLKAKWLREMEYASSKYPQELIGAMTGRLSLIEKEITNATRYQIYLTLTIRNHERLLGE